MPFRLIFGLILFAFFFFLCGFAHLLLAFGMGHTTLMTVVQCGNALVSTTTAFYVIPLIPDMFALVDTVVGQMQKQTKDSESKLFTFMAFLCHEIRNPLFAITSSAESLHDTALTSEQTEELASICDSSLLMLQLVNDVLDLSKLDSGKMELECREFDLHALFKRLGDNMARQVDRKHQGAVKLRCTLGEKVPKYVRGDSVRLLQIVYNLLSNSCKFTSIGSIDLRVDVLELKEQVWHDEEDPTSGYTFSISYNRPTAALAGERQARKIQCLTSHCKTQDMDDDEERVFSMALLGADACRTVPGDGADQDDIEANERPSEGEKMAILSIIVADTGVGIPPERLDVIFEPYTQAKLSDFRQHGGTGLGLSIISSLIKIMGGAITVTSRPGEGAKFHLKLPIQVPSHAGHIALDDTVECPSLNASGQNMDYVGELLPKDKKQVPELFLKCQRLPYFPELPREDMAAMSAEAKAGAMNCNNAPQPQSKTYQKHAATEISEPPLFEISSSTVTSNSGRSSTSLSPAFPIPANRQQHNLLEEFGLGPMDIPVTKKVMDSFHLPTNDHVVLVVDDNSVNRKILGKMLAAFGLEHRMACNGQEAVDALLASRNHPLHPGNTDLPHYSLVLMDLSMPVMDGPTAIQTIRLARITVPIVALSANVLSEERDRSIGLGADEFHSKPILRNDLHAICERYLLSTINGYGAIPCPKWAARENGHVSTIHQPATTINSYVTPLVRAAQTAIAPIECHSPVRMSLRVNPAMDSQLTTL